VQVAETLPYIFGRDWRKIEAALFAPGGVLLYGMKVSAASVHVAKRAVETFCSGEDCRATAVCP